MDAGNFPTYEKIINTTPLPRTRQENGWFYLELSFSPEGSTRSVSCPMRLEFGTFGDVCRIDISAWSSKMASGAQDRLAQHMTQLQPPGVYRHDRASDVLSLQIMENKAAREKQVNGLLIFNTAGDLVCLATALK